MPVVVNVDESGRSIDQLNQNPPSREKRPRSPQAAATTGLDCGLPQTYQRRISPSSGCLLLDCCLLVTLLGDKKGWVSKPVVSKGREERIRVAIDFRRPNGSTDRSIAGAPHARCAGVVVAVVMCLLLLLACCCPARRSLAAGSAFPSLGSSCGLRGCFVSCASVACPACPSPALCWVSPMAGIDPSRDHSIRIGRGRPKGVRKCQTCLEL